MAFYKSKYTGTEIDQRLAQGTYDDAVKAGFTGSKEEFDKIIVAFDENAQQKLDAAQPKIDHRLETLNKSIVDAINELHDEVSQKQDVGDYADKGEFEVFKDEVAAIYATKGQVSEEIDRAKEAEEKLSDSITTVNNNLVNAVNTINKNVSDSLTVVNEAIKQNAETLVAEIEQRKEADIQLENQHNTDIATINETIDSLKDNSEAKKQEVKKKRAVRLSHLTSKFFNFRVQRKAKRVAGKCHTCYNRVTKRCFSGAGIHRNRIARALSPGRGRGISTRCALLNPAIQPFSGRPAGGGACP